MSSVASERVGPSHPPPSRLSAPLPERLESSAPSSLDGLKGLSPRQELKRLSEGRIPCARTSLLAGIATAVGTIGVGAVAGRGLRRSLNWGVGAFVFVSIASWETCRRSRVAEAKQMRTIIGDHASRRRPPPPSAPVQ